MCCCCLRLTLYSLEPHWNLYSFLFFLVLIALHRIASFGLYHYSLVIIFIVAVAEWMMFMRVCESDHAEKASHTTALTAEHTVDGHMYNISDSVPGRFCYSCSCCCR